MNYRHAFHAGNFADVLKHLVLAQCLEHLGKKSKPYRVIDTHAGVGVYDLTGDEARRSPEWEGGIGRLLNADIPAELDDALNPYLDVIWAARMIASICASFTRMILSPSISAMPRTPG